jgi:toxin ParE1/3/4
VLRIVFTSLADADTAQIIGDPNKQAGENVADRCYAYFDSLYRRLERFPDCGAPRPKLGRYVRIAIVSPYVIIYEHIDDDLVMIMRVVHGRRKITRRSLRDG